MTVDPRYSFYLSLGLAILGFLAGASAQFSDLGLSPTTTKAILAAISLLRTDPFTGEILNASITLDANVLSTLIAEHARNLPITLTNGQSRTQQVLLRDTSRTMTDDRYLFMTARDEMIDKAEARMANYGWTNDECDFASEMADESALGYDALMMAGHGAVSQKLTKQVGM